MSDQSSLIATAEQKAAVQALSQSDKRGGGPCDPADLAGLDRTMATIRAKSSHIVADGEVVLTWLEPVRL